MDIEDKPCQKSKLIMEFARFVYPLKELTQKESAPILTNEELSI
jgi:hypothetical protein